jgi:transposase InsO family protein
MLEGRPPARLRHSWEARCRLVQMVLSGLSPHAASVACGMSRSTAYRLLGRYRQGGWGALRDQRPVPRRQPRRLSDAQEREIVAIRQRTKAGPVVIAAITGRPASTIGKVLRRWGCSRLPRPERHPVRRYERDRPGELLHVDTKKLGRFHVVGKRILRDGRARSRHAGWQHLHVAIDDHSRLAYAEVLAGQDKHACAAFLRRAVAWYAGQGIVVERVLSDNAKAYHSHLWRDTCNQLAIKRRFTQPYTPRTNGKAEALIKTMLREWAYRYAYPTSQDRSRALSGWIRWYNKHRPHGSLNGRPPTSRVSHVRGQNS